MRLGLSHNSMRTLIANLVMLAFCVHALIPQGFMPASDGPLSVQICPEGFPQQLLPHAHHHSGSGSHWHTEHCVFASACAAGPIPHLPSLSYISLVQYTPVAACISTAVAVQVVYLPQPRGPPSA
jgi:hypothetical protein